MPKIEDWLSLHPADGGRGYTKHYTEHYTTFRFHVLVTLGRGVHNGACLGCLVSMEGGLYSLMSPQCDALQCPGGVSRVLHHRMLS